LKRNNSSDLGDKKFIIQILIFDSKQAKTVLNYLEQLEHEWLGIVFENSMLPSYFEYTSQEKMLTAYYLNYVSLNPLKHHLKTDTEKLEEISLETKNPDVENFCKTFDPEKTKSENLNSLPCTSVISSFQLGHACLQNASISPNASKENPLHLLELQNKPNYGTNMQILQLLSQLQTPYLNQNQIFLQDSQLAANAPSFRQYPFQNLFLFPRLELMDNNSLPAISNLMMMSLIQNIFATRNNSRSW